MPTGVTSADAPPDTPTNHPGAEVEDPFPRARSALRLWVYGLVLALLAFVQQPGRLVGDTKFDLVVDPGRFMGRALHMWDGSGFLGQIQNQAYGYFFPMGPFFWLGEQAHLDMWVVQRLWWTLVLCVAFFGVLRVATVLGLGRPWTQVLAAFAYALSCHVTTVIGSTSIEVWPGAVAPWILWCVIRGTTGGSERRWAAAAALLLAACGGVNAAAVLGALPLAACWLVTRAGRRAWVFAGWWVACTALVTLWWVVPLLLLGAYGFPFLDYIESASVTTLPTGLSDVLGGTSDWVFFYGGSLFPAGYDLATTPYLLANAAALAGLGVAGIARRDNPHRGFLLLALVLGCLLVSFGYDGAGHGWWADTRQAWLDGALAPLRNLHKFDNVLRLPLVLGMAHLLGRLAIVGPRRETVHRVAAGVAALAVVVTTSPWWMPEIPPEGAISSVPDYWREAGAYLDRHDDGTFAVVVPAAGTGLYLWGSPRDEVLQPLTHAPWVTRNTIPFTQPGAVVLLNAITDVVESGRPSPYLAQELAANGIGRIVVRNDLNRLLTNAPDPVALHSVLDGSPGIEKEASFGPPSGADPATTGDNGVRIAPEGGLSGVWTPVEVYRVTLPVATVATVPDSSVRVVAGGAPGGRLQRLGHHARHPGDPGGGRGRHLGRAVRRPGPAGGGLRRGAGQRLGDDARRPGLAPRPSRPPAADAARPGALGVDRRLAGDPRGRGELVASLGRHPPSGRPRGCSRRGARPLVDHRLALGDRPAARRPVVAGGPAAGHACGRRPAPAAPGRRGHQARAEQRRGAA